MITIQEQPTKTSCGQTAIAMVLGLPATTVIEYYGHADLTYSKDHVKTLRHFGATCPDTYTIVDNRRKYKLPELCLLRINRRGSRRGHLMVHHEGIIYDPWMGRTFYLENFKDFYPQKRIDRYLEITYTPLFVGEAAVAHAG